MIARVSGIGKNTQKLVLPRTLSVGGAVAWSRSRLHARRNDRQAIRDPDHSQLLLSQVGPPWRTAYLIISNGSLAGWLFDNRSMPSQLLPRLETAGHKHLSTGSINLHKHKWGHNWQSWDTGDLLASI